ncbi:MAG: hypothetical protein ACYTBP_12415 [Planctomycetota bacterium]|jgi:hypothetical protein
MSGDVTSQRNRAAAPTTAHKNIQQHESYFVFMNTSTKNFRELIANLLIGLQTQTLTVQQYRHSWQLFEAILRQYVDLKYGRAG